MPPPLSLGSHVLDWSRPALLGIVNATPDSFSDGGRFATADAAIAHGLRLLDEGADGLDVGGESTRPGAPSVSAQEELERVLPVVRGLVAKGALVSVDTTKVSVARAALDAGALIVNDVGLGSDLLALASCAASFGAAYLRMHSRGTAETMRSDRTLMTYDEGVSVAVVRSLAADAAAIVSAGVNPSKVLLDPGLGFAKAAGQSLEVLARVRALRALGYAVCVGPSRKSFIDAAEAYADSWGSWRASVDERIGGGAAAVAFAVTEGVELLRVHDVAVMRQAARVAHALRLRAGERGEA